LEPPLCRLLVVVRRGDTSLYERLWEDFHRPDLRTPVEQFWDRRQAERRLQASPVGVDRRSGDRRQRVPETWTMWGFVVATVRR